MTRNGIAAAGLCAMLGGLACMPLRAQQSRAAVPAIWKTQEISFHFQSFTTFYSCSSLEEKSERILRALGVRAKARVYSVDCTNGVARMPRVDLEVTGPVEATPAAFAEREQDRSKRELAARVRGEKEDPEALAEFPAQWRRVSLSRGQLGLEPGDCELIEEFRRKVLPKLAVKITQDSLRCSPNQLSLGQPQLEVEALLPQPKPDESIVPRPQAR